MDKAEIEIKLVELISDTIELQKEWKSHVVDSNEKVRCYPSYGTSVFYVDSMTSEIIEVGFRNGKKIKNEFDLGLLHMTKKEAINCDRWRKINTEIKRIADFVPDWGNTNQPKYYIVYDKERGVDIRCNGSRCSGYLCFRAVGDAKLCRHIFRDEDLIFWLENRY